MSSLIPEKQDLDPDGQRLPIKLDATTNRTFQISEALRDRHGYPKITPQLRAKVFGLNATRPYKLAADELRKYVGHDAVAQSKHEYAERPNPSYVTYGPRTRREFLNLRVWHAGEP